MQPMKARRFFLLSVGLVIAAIALRFIALSEFNTCAGIITQSVSQPESQRSLANALVLRHRIAGSVVSVAGFALALGSLTLVLVSARKREPAWRLVVLGLLVVYLMLQFVLV